MGVQIAQGVNRGRDDEAVTGRRKGDTARGKDLILGALDKGVQNE